MLPGNAILGGVVILNRFILLIFIPVFCTAGVIRELKDMYNLSAGTWYVVSTDSSRMNTISYVNDGTAGEKAIVYMITAWNSGAYDPVDQRMYITGGGHNDYYGTEGYYFNFASMSWRLAWDRGWTNSYGGSCVESGGDPVQPNQRHTYDGLEFDPVRRKFIMHQGSLSCQTGGQSSKFWEWDVDTKTWEDVTEFDDKIHLYLGCNGQYNPKDSCYYFHNDVGLYKYDLANRTYSTINGSDAISYGCVATIDTSRNWYIYMGRGELVYIDLDDSTAHEIESTNGSTIEGVQDVGVDYDPVADELVAFASGSVWTMNMTTFVWTEHNLTGKPTGSGANYDNKIFQHWKYLPDFNAFIYVGLPTDSVYIYKNKLADGEWGARSTTASVVQARNFNDSLDVINFLHRAPSHELYWISAWDSTQQASGNGSLRMYLVDTLGEGGTNDWRINFGDDATGDTLTSPKEFKGYDGADGSGSDLGTDMWIQWRQMWDSTALDNYYDLASGRGGWKQAIITDGDSVNGSIMNSCLMNHLVIQEVEQRLTPAMYHSCGTYEGILEVINTNGIHYTDTTNSELHTGRTDDTRFHNVLEQSSSIGDTNNLVKYGTRQAYRVYDGSYGASTPYQYYTRPVPTEYPQWPNATYHPNEWMTFMVNVELGEIGSANSSIESGTLDGWTYSSVRLWMYREDGTMTSLINLDSIVLKREDGTDTTDSHEGYGKIWFTVYHTGLVPDTAVARGIGTTWYDEVIVSKDSIATPWYYGYGVQTSSASQEEEEEEPITGGQMGSGSGRFNQGSGTITGN